MADNISVRMKCFSHVRQALRKEEIVLSLPMSSTCSDLEREIRNMANGRLDGITFRFAVNLVYKPDDQVLNHGDEVTLIPPVQGG